MTQVEVRDRRRQEARVRQQRLGRQITLAREGNYSQAELGRRLGDYLDREIPQPTISRWEMGTVNLGIEELRAVELVLDLPGGTLLAASGYIDLERIDDIEGVIMTDPELHASQRRSVLSIYRTFVQTSKLLFERDER